MPLGDPITYRTLTPVLSLVEGQEGKSIYCTECKTSTLLEDDSMSGIARAVRKHTCGQQEASSG